MEYLIQESLSSLSRRFDLRFAGHVPFYKESFNVIRCFTSAITVDVIAAPVTASYVVARRQLDCYPLRRVWNILSSPPARHRTRVRSVKGSFTDYARIFFATFGPHPLK